MSQAPMNPQGRSNSPDENLGNKAAAQKEDAQQQLRQGKEAAAETAESLKQQGKQVVSDAKAQVARAAEDVRAAAGQGVEQAKTQAAEMLERQKAGAASGIASFKDALQSASKTLRDDHNESAAGVADAAAKQLGSFADYIQRRPVGDLLHDVEQLTRRRPEVVLGGLFVAGLAAARFLKASSRGPASQGSYAIATRGPSPYGAGQRGSSPLGSTQYGSTQQGSAQYGSTQYGSTQYGSAQAGSTQYGSGQVGSNQTGSNPTGTNQTGTSQTGTTGSGSAVRAPRSAQQSNTSTSPQSYKA